MRPDSRSVTLRCASCHDPQVDPIYPREYSGLSSFFDDIEEWGLCSHFTRSVPTPALALPTAKQEQRLGERDSDVRAAEERLIERDAALEDSKQLREALRRVNNACPISPSLQRIVDAALAKEAQDANLQGD